MFDHEYTLVAHPRLRARLSYRSGDGDLAAATVSLDYRRDEWTEEAAVDLPDSPEESGVEWRGLDVALYRDGERVVGREVSPSVVSTAAEAFDLADRFAPALARRVRTVAERAASDAPGDRVEMTQTDGSTVEALAPPAQAAFEVYEGRDGRWRWRLVHDNGNVIADSGQGYSSRQAAEKGLRSVKRNALGAAVERTEADPDRDARSTSDAEGDGPGSESDGPGTESAGS